MHADDPNHQFDIPHGEALFVPNSDSSASSAVETDYVYALESHEYEPSEGYHSAESYELGDSSSDEFYYVVNPGNNYEYQMH